MSEYFITFIVCIISRALFSWIFQKYELKFFLFWLCVCVAYYIFWGPAWIVPVMVYIFVTGFGAKDYSEESSKPSSYSDEEEEKPDWRFYGDGKVEVKKAWGTGYVDMEGNDTWEDLLGNEHRRNGEVIMKNAYLKNRYDIYKDNVCIGYYYKDAVGLIQRVDYQ